MRPIVRSFLTEINIGSSPVAGANIEFDDYPYLQDVWLTGIEFFQAATLSISPNNNTVVALGTGLTITLVDKDQVQVVREHPCNDLLPLLNGGRIRQFIPFKINLVKSYLTIRDAAGLNPDESALFNILYMTNEDYAKYR